MMMISSSGCLCGGCGDWPAGSVETWNSSSSRVAVGSRKTCLAFVIARAGRLGLDLLPGHGGGAEHGVGGLGRRGHESADRDARQESLEVPCACATSLGCVTRDGSPERRGFDDACRYSGRSCASVTGGAALLARSGRRREVLRLAYPLILATCRSPLQVFVDRLFLTWYSAEAVAGAVTGLFMTLAVVSLFSGTGEYLTTFIAQYLGAGRPRRVGPAFWQGIYFSLAGGRAHRRPAPAHRARVRAGRPRRRGASARGHLRHASSCAAPSRSCSWRRWPRFFAGRGQTRVVLVVNVSPRSSTSSSTTSGSSATAASRGRGGGRGLVHGGGAGPGRADLPRADPAAVAPAGLRHAVRLALRARRCSSASCASGCPAGLQYSIEILAFAIFMMIVGRIGTAPLAASGIAFNLNMIVFMPMLGLGVAVSALVGRYLGADQPERARSAPRGPPSG